MSRKLKIAFIKIGECTLEYLFFSNFLGYVFVTDFVTLTFYNPLSVTTHPDTGFYSFAF